MDFAQFVPLIVLICVVAPALRFGWRVSWITAILGGVPILNLFVIYFIGKQIYTRIDELEERLAKLDGKAD